MSIVSIATQKQDNAFVSLGQCELSKTNAQVRGSVRRVHQGAPTHEPGELRTFRTFPYRVSDVLSERKKHAVHYVLHWLQRDVAMFNVSLERDLQRKGVRDDQGRGGANPCNLSAL
jgi:hypothetical protein